jgi:hypothetical protein
MSTYQIWKTLRLFDIRITLIGSDFNIASISTASSNNYERKEFITTD